MKTPAVKDQGSATVCAVVVTHNRHELLVECLDRLERQSRVPDEILVVDNASEDETPAMLARRDGVEVLRLEENVGGAGGFARGVELAYKRGHDWLWLMDDDTFTDAQCLDALLAGIQRAPQSPSVMSSVVHWRDGTLHPMNRPWLRLDRRGEFAEAADVGLAPIRASTMVSIMISRAAVSEHGLPPAHYFLWLDDMEYTGRILRNGRGYLVPESTALHWTPRPYTTLTDTRERFYYKARNHLWVLRGSSFRGLERARYARNYVQALVAYLRNGPSKLGALQVIARGIWDGLRRPRA